MKKLIYFILGLLVSAACTETLYDDETPPAADEGNGIQFSVTTLEQADMTIGIGQTRAAAGDTLWQAYRQADRFVAHQLEGDNPCGLNVQRMPLPYVGIHPGTVNTQRAQEAMTRAPLSEMVKADGTSFHDSLTIWGCVFDPDNHDNTTNHYFLFSQTLLKRIRNWRSSVQWPYDDGKYMRFCAVSPALESMNMTLASQPKYDDGTLTPPTFNYTLPETAAEMRDVLFGTSDPLSVDVQSIGSKTDNLGKDNKTVNLTFQHALTAIRFAQGKIPKGITIKKISLKHVYTKGTYNPAASDPATGTNGAWNGISTTGNYSIWPTFEGSGTSNTYIDNDSVFFMIPHTVENAELEVEIVVKERTHTLKCSLKGDVWKKGYTVTYKLTIGEVEDGYYLVAKSPAAHEHSDSPITGTFPIHSYHSYWDYSADSENKTHAVNWKVAGYYKDEGCTTPFDGSDATNAPTWLSVTGTNSGTSDVFTGGDGSLANYTITGQSYTKSGKHKTILSGNSAQASALDLSWYSPNAVGSDKEKHKFQSQQTANCYIVNRGGTYTFPLVYGNGGTGSPFIDHLGTTITHSSIKEQIEAKNLAEWEEDGDENHRKRHYYSWNAAAGNGQSLRAIVVWQDVKDLVSASTTGINISFSVNQDIIQPSNAVIALQGRKLTHHQIKSSETWGGDTFDKQGDWETFWTWHIWITDEVYPNDGNDNDTNVPYDAQYLNYNTPNRDHLVTITNYSKQESKILPVNLGWVPDKDEFGYYSHREVWVKLEQTEKKDGGTAATTKVKIEQHARQPLITGTSTVYQWGRPTALPDINKKTVYMGSEFSSETFKLKNINISNMGDIIAQPTKMFRRSSDSNSWFDTSNIPAYWAATKTVYDPCPPGFQLPDYRIFSGFSLTGETGLAGTSLNMWQDAAEAGKGAYLYVLPNAVVVTGNTTAATYTMNDGHDRYEQTVYMPATGQYQGDKDADTDMADHRSENVKGMFWCYGFNSESKGGECLWIHPEWSCNGTNNKPAIGLPKTDRFSTAMPIRPAESLP